MAMAENKKYCNQCEDYTNGISLAHDGMIVCIRCGLLKSVEASPTQTPQPDQESVGI